MFNFLNRLFRKLRPAPNLFVAFDSGGHKKPTIILLHGIAASSNSFNKLIKELDTKKYRVIAIDLLGFGQSPKPANLDYDVFDHAKSIKRTINKLRVKKPFILMGHSMGSIISACYTRKYPNEVRELFLLSLPLYTKDNTFKQSIISQKQTDMFLKIYEYLSDKKNVAITSASIVRKLFKVKDGMEVTEENWNSFRQSLTNTIVNQNTYDDIKNIKVPIHVYYGLLDGLLVMTNVNKLKSQSNVTITKLSLVHHEINKKYATAVAKRIF